MPRKELKLTEEDYPFTLIAALRSTGRICWMLTVPGPCEIFVPPLRKTYGSEVVIRNVDTYDFAALFVEGYEVLWADPK
jgi:hypothetical protein